MTNDRIRRSARWIATPKVVAEAKGNHEWGEVKPLNFERGGLFGKTHGTCSLGIESQWANSTNGSHHNHSMLDSPCRISC